MSSPSPGLRCSPVRALALRTVVFRLAHGRATLDFSSDTPPVRESPHADSRPLSFALYDLRLTLPNP